jgi:pilus assembly protein CpaB
MVIVAARDLYQGLPITAEDLYAVQIAPKFLPEGVFLSPEHVVGRVPRERVLANDLVRGERLADPENGVGLQTILPRGLRALSVDLGDGRALSGFLQPGSYVDVLVTLAPDGEGRDRDPVTRTLLQAVFVLGVDSRRGSESRDEAKDRRGRNQPSVTLLVTADQAEQVAHADALGELTLSLRAGDDVATTEATAGVDLDALRTVLVRPPPPVRRVGPAPPPTEACVAVKHISGGSSREEWVDSAGIPCDPVPDARGSR